MRNTTLLIAALGLACPLVAHGQGLPLPGDELAAELAKAAEPADPEAPTSVRFSVWREGVVPRRGKALTVDLQTGEVSLVQWGGGYRELGSARLHKLLPLVRAAVEAVLRPEAKIDPPSLSLDGPFDNRFDWSAYVSVGDSKVEIGPSNNPAVKRFRGVMMMLVRKVQNPPRRGRRPPPIPPVWPPKPWLPAPPRLPILPKPPILPQPPILGFPPSLLLRLGSTALRALHQLPFGQQIAAAMARLVDRLTDAGATAEHDDSGQSGKAAKAEQREGMIGAFGPH